MKIDDIAVMQDLRLAYVNASRVLVDLQRENITISMYINGFDIYKMSGPGSGNKERNLVRSVAIQVWQKYIEEIKAKLMLLGVEIP